MKKNKGCNMKKNIKRIIALLLCVTLVLTVTMTKYEKRATATGLGEAIVASGIGSLGLVGPILIGTLIAGGVILTSGMTWQDVKDLYAEGQKVDLDKMGNQVKEDFYNYSVQAVKNNHAAAESEAQMRARVKSTIDDFTETLAGGFIDTTSEAYDWFMDFCRDIRNAVKGKSQAGSGSTVIDPYNLDGTHLVATFTEKNVYDLPEDEFKNLQAIRDYKIDIEGLSGEALKNAFKNGLYLGVTANAVEKRDGELVLFTVVDGLMTSISNKKISSLNAKINGSYITSSHIDRIFGYSKAKWDMDLYLPVFQEGAPFNAAAGSGVTDVPGVSNVNDYVSIGRDLPFSGHAGGAYDLCDPLGNKRQIALGADIPARNGAKDWHDLIKRGYTGELEWERVANSSDVIRIGNKDKDSIYSRDNSKSWEAYLDGAGIQSLEWDAEGNAIITLVNGQVITIPKENVSDVAIEGTGEVSKPLDKDVTLPVDGTLVLPLPDVVGGNPGADPEDGYSGNMTFDEETGKYILDFRKLFPFCIPYDIYHLVKLLDADPQAPVIHYKFYFMEKSYNIDLNLNKFNAVAAILRQMEVLLFVVGLAAATRRIYIRG